MRLTASDTGAEQVKRVEAVHTSYRYGRTIEPSSLT